MAVVSFRDKAMPRLLGEPGLLWLRMLGLTRC